MPEARKASIQRTECHALEREEGSCRLAGCAEGSYGFPALLRYSRCPAAATNYSVATVSDTKPTRGLHGALLQAEPFWTDTHEWIFEPHERASTYIDSSGQAQGEGFTDHFYPPTPNNVTAWSGGGTFPMTLSQLQVNNVNYGWSNLYDCIVFCSNDAWICPHSLSDSGYPNDFDFWDGNGNGDCTHGKA